MANRLAEAFGRRGCFVVGQTECNNTPIRVPRGNLGQLYGQARRNVRSAVTASPRPLRLPSGGEASRDEDVENLVVRSELSVIGQVHRRFDPYGPVGGGVLDHFGDQPSQIVQTDRRRPAAATYRLSKSGERTELLSVLRGREFHRGSPVRPRVGGTHRTFRDAHGDGLWEDAAGWARNSLDMGCSFGRVAKTFLCAASRGRPALPILVSS